MNTVRPSGMRRWGWAAASLLAVPLFGFDRGCVTSPTTDTVVTSASVPISGSIGRYDGRPI